MPLAVPPTADIWTILSALGAVASALIAAAGLGFIAWQLHATRRIAAADFALHLEAEWVDHFAGVYQKFLPEGQFAADQPGPKSIEDRVQIETYLDFFATLMALNERGHLTLTLIDEMFAYRFFVAVNNPHAKAILEMNKPFWSAIYNLSRKWRAYRQGKKLPIIPDEHHIDD